MAKEPKGERCDFCRAAVEHHCRNPLCQWRRCTRKSCLSFGPPGRMVRRVGAETPSP